MERLSRHLLIFFIFSIAGSQSGLAETDVRVGIVAYEDFHTERNFFETVFSEISSAHPSVSFRIAIGTYGDVLHWMDRQLIDVAVLTPGAFLRVMHQGDSLGESNQEFEYLASVQLPSTTSPFAKDTRTESGFRRQFQSVCLVPETSPIRSADDLKRAAAADAIEFVFVHPVSVSGYQVPMEGLRRLGIDPNASQTRFSYSHTQSLRLLKDSGSTKQPVAFVWDAAAQDAELQAGLRQIHLTQLEQISVPHDVVVGRLGYEHAEQMQKWLTEVQSEFIGFSHDEDWRVPFDRLSDTLSSSQAWQDPSSQRVSLEQITHSLLHYSRSQPRPPRLALVLSGGGAKCSYQVGAVAALEEQLAELRQKNPEEGLDVALVVGTSGGAINAVPVAMGITRSEQGRDAFRETWKSLDQRDIVRPSWPVRANMILWFTVIQLAILIGVASRFAIDSRRRRSFIAWSIVLFSLVEIGFRFLPINPWSLLGSNHALHHLWLWLGFGFHASAWISLAIGIALLLFGWVNPASPGEPLMPNWIRRTVLLVGILGLPLVQLLTILFHQQTLSTGIGMQETLSSKFYALVDEHLRLQKLDPLKSISGSDAGQRLRDVSRNVIDRKLLQRDLVITGSCLSQSTDELPSDLYFYASVDQNASPPPFGKRGVSLADRPECLLDVVMGSGSIFPVFPSRVIEDFPRDGQQIELIDGGFAHNSPIEAAVLWGATHVILLEASPRTRSERGNFLRNASSAFQHLYRQAQLVDTHSRGRVTVYSLAPQPPHMCVLDFADNLIVASMDRGYQDVATNQSTFQREFGEPVFLTLAPSR